MADLDKLVAQMEALGDRNADVFTLVESRLFEKRLVALTIPSSQPVDGPVGSGFGFRVLRRVDAAAPAHACLAPPRSAKTQRAAPSLPCFA